MFPDGAAGYGLLILRLCAAGMLMRGAIPNETIRIPLWVLAGAAIFALLLCLGVLTPLSCGVSGLVQITLQFSHADRDPLQLIFSLFVTTALFLIGPGAFSVDSRLFGRRLIIRS
jgi:uncharacterized membrane protein YphA (DoxX/SURF4 family)